MNSNRDEDMVNLEGSRQEINNAEEEERQFTKSVKINSVNSDCSKEKQSDTLNRHTSSDIGNPRVSDILKVEEEMPKGSAKDLVDYVHKESSHGRDLDDCNQNKDSQLADLKVDPNKRSQRTQSEHKSAAKEEIKLENESGKSSNQPVILNIDHKESASERINEPIINIPANENVRASCEQSRRSKANTEKQIGDALICKAFNRIPSKSVKSDKLQVKDINKEEQTVSFDDINEDNILKAVASLRNHIETKEEKTQDELIEKRKSISLGGSKGAEEMQSNPIQIEEEKKTSRKECSENFVSKMLNRPNPTDTEDQNENVEYYQQSNKSSFKNLNDDLKSEVQEEENEVQADQFNMSRQSENLDGKQKSRRSNLVYDSARVSEGKGNGSSRLNEGEGKGSSRMNKREGKEEVQLSEDRSKKSKIQGEENSKTSKRSKTSNKSHEMQINEENQILRKLSNEDNNESEFKTENIEKELIQSEHSKSLNKQFQHLEENNSKQVSNKSSKGDKNTINGQEHEDPTYLQEGKSQKDQENSNKVQPNENPFLHQQDNSLQDEIYAKEEFENDQKEPEDLEDHKGKSHNSFELNKSKDSFVREQEQNNTRTVFKMDKRQSRNIQTAPYFHTSYKLAFRALSNNPRSKLANSHYIERSVTSNIQDFQKIKKRMISVLENDSFDKLKKNRQLRNFLSWLNNTLSNIVEKNTIIKKAKTNKYNPDSDPHPRNKSYDSLKISQNDILQRYQTQYRKLQARLAQLSDVTYQFKLNDELHSYDREISSIEGNIKLLKKENRLDDIRISKLDPSKFEQDYSLMSKQSKQLQDRINDLNSKFATNEERMVELEEKIKEKSEELERVENEYKNVKAPSNLNQPKASKYSAFSKIKFLNSILYNHKAQFEKTCSVNKLVIAELERQNAKLSTQLNKEYVNTQNGTEAMPSLPTLSNKPNVRVFKRVDKP